MLKINKIWFINTLFCSCLTVYAAPKYTTDEHDKAQRYRYLFSIDKNMTSKSSSDLALSVVEAYRYTENTLLTDKNALTKTLSYITRFAVAEWTTTSHHEMGGHGARAREFGMGVKEYKLGLASGYTKFTSAGCSKMLYDLDLHESILIDVAGMQASYLFAENIKSRYLQANQINPIYGVAYFSAKFDQPYYILSTKKANNSSGHDVNNYIKKINQLYNYEHLNHQKIKKYAYLDLLDPMLFYSLYAFATDSAVSLPMIPVKLPGINKEFGYLPSARSILTPYGPEMGLVNLFKIDNHIIQVNLNYGNNDKFKSYAFSIKSDDIVQWDRFSFGSELMLWSQPQLLKAGPQYDSQNYCLSKSASSNFLKAKIKKGMLLTINSSLEINKKIKLHTHTGYKSAGFVVGESLKAGPILKAGISVAF